MVVAIVVLMSTVVGGLYIGSYENTIVKKTARDIWLAARYGRIVAVERQVKCSMLLNEQNRSFCLVTENKNNPAKEKDVVIRDNYSKPRQLGRHVEFEIVRKDFWQDSSPDQGRHSNVISFYPSGCADGAVIQVGNSRNHYTIRINPVNGKASIMAMSAEKVPPLYIDLDN